MIGSVWKYIIGEGYTIYITCVGKDITDDIISGITSD